MTSNPLGVRFGHWVVYAVAVVSTIITIIFLISSSPRSGFYNVSLFLLLLCIYLLPVIFAIIRHHSNTNAIAVLNVYFGWTFVGWVIALVWSIAADIEKVSASGGFAVVRNLIEVLERKFVASADVSARWVGYLVVAAVAGMFLGAAVTHYFFAETAFFFRW